MLVVSPNVAIKSFVVAKVTGTKAGPAIAVPIIPAGIPDGCIAVGPVRSIVLAETPADLNDIFVSVFVPFLY